MVQKSAAEKMSAIAMTDHGNMMGAFKFVSAIIDHNKNVKKTNEAAIENGEEPTQNEIKPIVGCEFFVCENHKDKSKKDNGYQIVLLAKNKNGYHNLAKLASIASIDGFYLSIIIILHILIIFNLIFRKEDGNCSKIKI